MSMRILTGDCRETLRSLADGSVQCVVTSPPYWGLRDYGHDGQLGLEATPQEYVERMVDVFREVRRVLRDDGTLWLNLGDSYASQPNWGRGGGSTLEGRKQGNEGGASPSRQGLPGLKAKDLVGIPWRVAFALQADGWWLRQDIIWSKPNPMPESVRDRCTKAHEYLFLLTKSERYFFDSTAIKENSSIEEGSDRNKRSVWSIKTRPFRGAHFATMPPELAVHCISAGTSESGCCGDCGTPFVRAIKTTAVGSRVESAQPKRVPTRPGWIPQSEIPHGRKTETIGWEKKCACKSDATACVVLDPFGGSGTVGMVANWLGRDSILCELNPEYVALIEERVRTPRVPANDAANDDRQLRLLG